MKNQEVLTLKTDALVRPCTSRPAGARARAADDAHAVGVETVPEMQFKKQSDQGGRSCADEKILVSLLVQSQCGCPVRVCVRVNMRAARHLMFDHTHRCGDARVNGAERRCDCARARHDANHERAATVLEAARRVSRGSEEEEERNTTHVEYNGCSDTVFHTCETWEKYFD